MKLDRLLSIVIMLLNRKLVQAKELADLFEVSVRTIYRDIETINQAGIPIVTYQGANGGIGLAEGYRLDRNLLTNNELAAIVTALQSISTSDSSQNHQMLVEKINSIIPAYQSEQFHMKTKQFIVDFSSWDEHGHLKEKLAMLKRAIEQALVVSFQYCDAQGEKTERCIEPYTLILKRQKWYVYAYCQYRQEFRMFKLFRMTNIVVHERHFTRENIAIEDTPWNQEWHAPRNTVRLVLRFQEKVRHLAEEWFGVESLLEDGEGSYIAEVVFPEDNWLYGFILSFGQDVEVVEPLHIRIIIKDIAQGIAQKYE